MSLNKLQLKLAMRRAVLKAAGPKKFRILDLYAGGEVLWEPLRAEFTVERYSNCGLDPKKAGPNPAAIPLFVEAMARDGINVVDIDAPTEPWEIWRAAAQRLHRPAAVFLSAPGRGDLCGATLDAMGIPASWELPPGNALSKLAPRFFLTPHFGRLEICRAWRLTAGNGAYFGLMVSPANGDTHAH